MCVRERVRKRKGECKKQRIFVREIGERRV